MAHTVKQVAGISGVSVRTLHFYDEIGLLKPAYLGANGYRFYEEAQLLTLQQILFYRELGMDLKQIKKILSRSDFDKIAALQSHRRVLRKNLAQTRKLIVTLDKTIEHLKGKKKMKYQEMFIGFTPQQQARHEQYLIDRFGDDMKESIAESKQKVSHWTKKDWEQAGGLFNLICEDMVSLMDQRMPSESDDVQAVIGRHYHWLCQFWTPTAESYAGHSQLIVDSGLRKAYEKFHPGLPEFAAAAMKVFAAREL
jgi:DNA-binding transcriptional MerR regulator